MKTSENVPSPSRSRLRRRLRYGLVALAALALGLFLARRHIGNLLAQKLDEQLVASGIYVSWKSASWIAGPGIRLRGLALYRDPAKRDRLALLGDVKARKGHRDWSRWDTVDVTVENSTLTLGSGDSETRLDRLDLDLRIEPGKADLKSGGASLQGLRIHAKGAYASGAGAAHEIAPTAPAAAKRQGGVLDGVDLAWLKDLKEWISFRSDAKEPVLAVTFQSRPADAGMDLDATLEGKAFQWHGQTWDFINVAVKTSLGDRLAPIEIACVRIGHAGRTAELSGAMDAESKVLRVGSFDSSLDVLGIARALAPNALKGLESVAARGALRLAGQGEIPMTDPQKVQWKGRVAVEGTLAYEAGETSVLLQNPSLHLALNDGVLSVSDFKTGLWGGSLDAPMTRVHLPSAQSKPRFETSVTIARARLQSVMDSFGAEQKQPGLVELDWTGGGGFELASVAGGGKLAIHDAEFFRIPLLGPLHLVFDRLAPGFGKDVASTLSAGHHLGGGVLRIEDLKLESKLTRIEANGTVDLSRQYAHLTAKAKLRGIVGMATALLSALLEIEGEGPVSDVHWKLKNMPGVGMIGDAAEAVGKTGEKVIKGAGEAAKETGKAAKGLLKIPGKLFQGK